MMIDLKVTNASVDFIGVVLNHNHFCSNQKKILYYTTIHKTYLKVGRYVAFIFGNIFSQSDCRYVVLNVQLFLPTISVLSLY